MTRNVLIAASLPAPPGKLFDMYLDRRAHGAFTGSPVVISAKPGSKFAAFGGMLSGKMLHVQPKTLIVQTWRSGGWAKSDADSVLIMTFHAEKGGGRIELSHIGVPLSDFAGISHGWEKYYWTPWRAYLESGGKK